MKQSSKQFLTRKLNDVKIDLALAVTNEALSAHRSRTSHRGSDDIAKLRRTQQRLQHELSEAERQKVLSDEAAASALHEARERTRAERIDKLLLEIRSTIRR
jgi:cob(I)alamin adenosyltransferase